MNLNKIPLFAMLNERMSWLNQRQQVLANNIANADTPGYKPNDLAPVNFEKLARDASRGLALAGTDAAHLASGARAGSASGSIAAPAERTRSPPSGCASGAGSATTASRSTSSRT